MRYYEIQEFYNGLITNEKKKIDGSLETLYSLYECKKRAELEGMSDFVSLFNLKIKMHEEEIKDSMRDIEFFKLNLEIENSKLINSFKE